MKYSASNTCNNKYTLMEGTLVQHIHGDYEIKHTQLRIYMGGGRPRRNKKQVLLSSNRSPKFNRRNEIMKY